MIPRDLPDIHFGKVRESFLPGEGYTVPTDAELLAAIESEEPDEEDEEEDEDAPASAELIELLGFDPDDLDEDEPKK